MNRTIRALQRVWTFSALALLALCPSTLAQENQWSPFDQSALTRIDVQGAREKAKAALETSSEPVDKDSVEARVRASLERRISLLDELDALMLRREELAAALADNPTRLSELEAEIARLEETGEPTAPQDATTEGYQALELRGASLRAGIDTVQSRVDAANRRLERAGELQGASAKRLAEARQKQEELDRQLDATPAGGSARDLLLLQSANAQLNARVAEYERLVLDEETQGDRLLGEYRTRSLVAAQLRLEQHERERQLYETTLQGVLQEQKARSEAELAAKEVEASLTEDPFGRFVARWEVDVARSENSRAEVAPFKVDVSTEAAEQEERLANDRKELERLRADVQASGTAGAVGRAIRQVYDQMEFRRKAVEYAVKPHYETRAEEFVNRRFEIDQLLYELNDRWKSETDESLGLESLSSEVAAERTKIARRLRDSLHASLQAERTALTEGINGLRKLRGVERERSQALDELETFIHAKVFWIRDQPALTTSTLGRIPEELGRVANWVRHLRAQAPGGAPAAAGTKTIALFLASIIVLPVISILIRRRTRRFLHGPDSSQSLTRAWGSVRRVAVAAVHCSLLPGCFVAFAALAPALDLGEDLSAVAVRLLTVLAVFFLLRSVGKTFFGQAGLAVQLSWMPEEPAESMRLLLRFVSGGVLVLVLPWSVVGAEFLEIDVLPRCLLTAFGLLMAIASYRWFSGSSAVADFVVGGASDPRSVRLRKGWTVFLVLGMSAALVLSVSGRGLAARAIGLSLVETVLTLLALAVVYRVVGRLLDQALKPAKKKRRKRSKEVDAQGEEERSFALRAAQVRGVVRAAFVLVGAWLVATYWGLNDQVLGAMQTLHLYSAGIDPLEGTQLWVTAGDVLYAVVVLLGTVWLLRHLPGIYELAVFPRFNLDRGVRYAIVTISRYGLFFLGAIAALRALQVDFSSLAWLVAAMGIGLGFGLQEIVSNFVSGIILLVERPIRVGDMVTVGDVIGKIDRINIRATTVLNQDRQEVIVPNRALIAQNVTNWTLASRVLRVIVHIGVAYGSDVQRVHDILSEVARADPNVLQEPPFQVFFMNHGESSLDFEVRVFIDDPDKRFPVTDHLNSAINRALADAGIEIPFPQRDVHIYSETKAPVGRE